MTSGGHPGRPGQSSEPGQRRANPLTCDEATEIIWAFEAGVDALGAEPGVVPVLAVAVRSGDVGRLPRPPLHFPAVVVLVARDDAVSSSATPADVALTDLSSLAKPPWVAVRDCTAALDDLAVAVARSPIAALTLVQLLRAGAGLSLDQGLLAESLAYSTLQSGPEFATWTARRPTPASLASEEGGDALLVSRHGDLMRIALNRPRVHNAYNTSMRDALAEALSVALLDTDIEVLLEGTGPSFCSGGDLTEFDTFDDPASANLVRIERNPGRLLGLLSSRVTAVVHGYCAGSGIELAAFASKVLARGEVTIWLPELAMGLLPGAGGTVSLPRRIGAGRTAWLALSGSRIDAATAISWGLLDGWL